MPYQKLYIYHTKFAFLIVGYCRVRKRYALLEILRQDGQSLQTRERVSSCSLGDINSILRQAHVDTQNVGGLQFVTKVCTLTHWSGCEHAGWKDAQNERRLQPCSAKYQGKARVCKAGAIGSQLMKDVTTIGTQKLLVCHSPVQAYGIIGCIRFTSGFYLLIVTRKAHMGSIRGKRGAKQGSLLACLMGKGM